jgi:hypothetical protein
MVRKSRLVLVAFAALVATAIVVLPAFADAPLPGAIFTTDSTCTGTNLNIYSDKGAVYLDGGPSHPGAAGLPPGDYYVQVTEPDGTLLGTSVGSGNDTPIHVDANGDFAACYQLSAILKTPSGSPGYDTTTNPGGEYKVWVSNELSFTNNSTKTDNFKVKESTEPPEQATLHVRKFYDANANGLNDDGQLITGWKTRIQNGMDIIRFTPVNIIIAPDDYTVTEFAPTEANWQQTTPNPVMVSLANGDDKTVEFGNLCTGAGGGLTLGFWSNKNGQALYGADDNALMVGLNLRDANGSNFDPSGYASGSAQFRPWLLNATATNMAYMLSAQLAAMELNVNNVKVNGNAIIYAPGTTSAQDANNGPLLQGFATVNSVMTEANTELGVHGLTKDGSPYRSYQEALKNALDRGNNNLNFVQSSPCSFTFAN